MDGQKRPMAQLKSIIILSDKSSGSSACQDLLSELGPVRHVEQTRHFENETLYWTKAASTLGRPQRQMVDSEVPIPRQEARSQLIDLLRENLDGFEVPPDDEELVIQGWRQLCERYAPIFIEKSPHHLGQASALELILEAANTLEDVDFLLIGLIRNPLDTIHSQYRRWKSPCAKVEEQWRVAYENLWQLKEESGLPVVIVRYEDMVSSLDPLRPVFDFCDAEPTSAMASRLHQGSVRTARKDPGFGFVLQEETRELAERYGYSREDTANESHLLWPLLSRTARWLHKAERLARRSARRLLPRPRPAGPEEEAG